MLLALKLLLVPSLVAAVTVASRHSVARRRRPGRGARRADRSAGVHALADGRARSHARGQREAAVPFRAMTTCESRPWWSQSRAPTLSRYAITSSKPPARAMLSGERHSLSVRDDSRRSSLSPTTIRSEEHTSELQSQSNLVCRLLLEKKKKIHIQSLDY